MGIIMSALAAAGDAGANSMDARLKTMAQEGLDEKRSALETQKAKVLIDYQKQASLDMDAQKRQGIMSRVGAAKDGVINKAMSDKYAQSDAAVADAAAGTTAAPLTLDQQAAIDQSKAIDKNALANDPHTYIQAAMASGDIDPKEVAALVQQADAFKHQQASQESQFLHADKSQAAAQRFQAGQQVNAQAFQAGESNKTRAQDDKRMKLMYGDSTTISEAEKKNWVQMYVTSGGVPRSAPPAVRNSVGTWAAQMNITPEDLASGRAKAKFDQAAATTAGHRAGTMAGIEAAMPAIIDNAVAMSSKLDKGRFVPLNQLMTMGEDQISDPDVAAFKVAHQALVSEYQLVIGRGGANVFALKEAGHALNAARSQEAYIAAANQVKKEIEINVNAMDKVRNNMGGSHAAPAGPSMAPKPAAAPGTVPDDIAALMQKYGK